MLEESMPRGFIPRLPASLSRSAKPHLLVITFKLTLLFSLPEPRDDRSLEAAVTREFSKYGTVFVKIRRDNQHMPFAFCQYTVSCLLTYRSHPCLLTHIAAG